MGGRRKKGKKTIDGDISPWWEEGGVKSLDHEQWNHQKKNKKKKKRKEKTPLGAFLYVYLLYF